MKLTTDQITTKIKAGQSFWVSSNSERKAALGSAKVLGVNYCTQNDGHGGFNIVRINNMRKSK